MLAALIATAAVAVAVACGGDDEDTVAQDTGPRGEPPGRTVTAPVVTAPEGGRTQTTTPPREDPGAAGGATSPEDSPSGAGDEEAARSEVVLTGRGGKIGPSVVKVPPFIAIRVVLRSADGKPYVLTLGGKVLRAGFKGTKPTASFDGLRPGEKLVGAGVAGKVTIEASAEPGP